MGKKFKKEEAKKEAVKLDGLENKLLTLREVFGCPVVVVISVDDSGVDIVTAHNKSLALEADGSDDDAGQMQPISSKHPATASRNFKGVVDYFG